jgi:glycosyltransferase involved in cell wall biosynthesis
LKEKGYKVELLYSEGKNYGKRIWDIYRKILCKDMKPYEFIFIGFAPQLILPVFPWKFRKNKVYIDFFISVYDTLVNDRKKIKEKTLAAKLIHRLDQKTLKRADGVIADTKVHKQYFAEEFQVPEKKIKVKYLQADTTIYKPMKVEKAEEWKDKFLVLYFGSILPLQGVEIVLQAVEKLKNEKSIHFLIVGPIKDTIPKVESDTVTYYDWLPQEELAEKIAMSDLCLAGHFCETIEKANRTIPGKAYIYSAMEKPMILGDTVANHELYKKSDTIAFVPRGNAEKLAQAIMKMKQR